MKKALKYLWIITVILTGFLGFNLRYSNDELNKHVLFFANFKELLEMEKDIGKAKEDIVDEQKNAGIAGVLIDKEDILEYNDFLKKNRLRLLLKIDSDGDIREYEKIIKDCKVKYIWFDYDEEKENRIKKGKEKGELSKTIGYPEDIDYVVKVIKENNLVVIAKERISQISIQDTKGIKDIIRKTDYSVNRMYSMMDKQLMQFDDRGQPRMNGDKLFYELMRAVVDRGIRVIEIKYIKELKTGDTPGMMYNETNLGVKKLSSFIKKMGYDMDGDLEKLDAKELNINYYLLVIFGLALTSAAYGKRLFNTDKKTTFIVFAVSMLSLMMVLPVKGIERNLALLASIIYSALSSLVVMRISETEDKKVMLKSVVSFLGISFLGGYTVVSCLSSLRYTMTLDLFRGVKIAFVMPLIMYTISYAIVYNIRISDILSYIKKKSKLGIAFVVALIGFIFAIYILRSGNFKILRASAFELRVREILEYVWKVRPRTKEIAIGYPMLMMFVHFRKSQNNIIKYILGFGMTIGSISVINSFCHVFTPIVISMSRGINGLITGVIIGKLLLILLTNESLKKFLQDKKSKMIARFSKA